MKRILAVVALCSIAFASVNVPDNGCGIRGAYFAMPLYSKNLKEGLLLSDTCEGPRCEPVHLRMFDATLYVVHQGLPDTLALTKGCKFRPEVNLERNKLVSRMKLFGVANAR